jgi:hypothetical protein
VAGPPVQGDGYLRREYSRGSMRIDVTLAHYGGGARSYAQWVAMSAGYPAADLDIPYGSGSGFWDCTGSAPADACSLHIQLQAGLHVEIMGGGRATRADVETLLAGLDLRSLATPVQHR